MLYMLGLVLLIVLPPVGLAFMLWLLWWKEPRDERRRTKRDSDRRTNWYEVEVSGPGPCPVCHHQNWQLGPMTLVPSGSFRILEWPNDSVTAVRRFICGECGASARYGMCRDKAEQGWIPLDRWAGGW